MARRISSIFSLGSNTSDASASSSRPRSAFNPDQLANNFAPSATLASPKSTPDLRPCTPSSQLPSDHQHDASRLSPMISPALLPANEAGGRSSPRLQKPLPQLAGLSDVERSARRTSEGGSRTSSRDGNSRAVSPARLTPTTPSAEHSKLSKRRSWIPGGRSRPVSQEVYVEQMPGFDAWNISIRANEHSGYDLRPLAGFQQVRRRLQRAP